MPHAESMASYLDQILPAVRQWGEDLSEEKFYVNKSWIEIRDDEEFHEVILHIFYENGEYFKSVNGETSRGQWRYLKGNKFLIGNKIAVDDDIEEDAKAELFDLSFLDNQFFILKKHGDQVHLGKPKYFVMVFEPKAKKLEWRDVIELLFNKYRNNNSFYITLAIIILLVIAIVLVLS